MVALLLLAVDPAQVGKQIDRPVLLPDERADPSDGTNPDAAASGDPKA
jgi:hypothetical protein